MLSNGLMTLFLSVAYHNSRSSIRQIYEERFLGDDREVRVCIIMLEVMFWFFVFFSLILQISSAFKSNS